MSTTIGGTTSELKKNRMETGWGDYKIPETIGRERRIDSRIGDNQS